MSDADRDEVVDAHNRLRQKLASGKEQAAYNFPPAANMLKLEWDDDLAQLAQMHANQCNFAHDCNKCRQVEEYAVGQNLFTSMSSEVVLKANWTQAVEAWYDEISLTPTNIIHRFKSSRNPRVVYGHFTQVIWADTWKIGCGYSVYQPADRRFKTQQLYTCNYGPAGNYQDSPIYKPGAAASQCPGNTAQDNDYPALCEVVGQAPEDESVKKLKDRSIYYCDFDDTAACRLRFLGTAMIATNKLFQYLTYKLTGPRVASFELPGPIRSPNGFCVTLVTRKGTSDPSGRSNSKLRMTITDQTYGMSSEAQFGMDSTDWVPTSMDLRSFTRPTTIKVTFDVPAGARDQILDVKSIAVTAGGCQ